MGDVRIFGKGDYYLKRLVYGREQMVVYWFPGPWTTALHYAWFFETLAEAETARVSVKMVLPEAKLIVGCLEDLTEAERAKLDQVWDPEEEEDPRV